MAIVRRFIDWLSSSLHVDGLDTTEYVERIERELGIVIRDEAVGTLATLGDLCKYVSAQRCEQGRPLSEEEIWTAVREITSDEFGVAASELHPGIRYVEDLNC
jgi:hypothetical protein